MNRSIIKATRIPKNHKIKMHLRPVWFGSRFMKHNSPDSKRKRPLIVDCKGEGQHVSGMCTGSCCRLQWEADFGTNMDMYPSVVTKVRHHASLWPHGPHQWQCRLSPVRWYGTGGEEAWGRARSERTLKLIRNSGELTRKWNHYEIDLQLKSP
jgi:hypothetical protein